MKLNKMFFDDKKIEAAANKHIETEYARYNSGKVEEEMICLRGKDSFKEGAKWAINEFLKNLWHPNAEEPDKSKSDIITLGFDNDAYLQFKESILWNEESWRHSISRCQIIKWAYLSDILPKQEGGEQ
jgi:hypothetical protein|nr:MAG: hypothetical protein [Bacteriophage sp.]